MDFLSCCASSLKRHGRALKSTSQLVGATPSVYGVYLLCMYINVHSYSIYFENIYLYLHVYIYIVYHFFLKDINACVYIINIQSTHTYIMETKTFILDAINHN